MATNRIAVATAMISLTAAAPPAADHALAVGTVIASSQESPVGGWRPLYRSTWAQRVQGDNVITETQECCIAVYQKGLALLVLRAEPVTRNARGEALTERIVRSKWLTRRADEIVTDCQILSISPQLSLYDNKTGAIRSVAIDNGEFVILAWHDPGSFCSFGD
jgi:hypothetical protein